MADSLPGTISLFSEAYAELIGSGETGLDAQARFYNDIATGTIKSAEILPIFARLASERAAPKIGIMKKTSIAEQGRFSNELSDMLMVASDSGIEKGMAEFFKTLADGVKASTPLVKGLSGAFHEMVMVMRPFKDLYVDFNRGLKGISEVSGIAEKNLLGLVGIGAALLTKWGRVAVAFTTVAMVLQDISWGIQGKGESVTGEFFSLMADNGMALGEFEKALFGVSSALLAIALGLKAIGVASGMAGLSDLLSPDGKGDKGGRKESSSRARGLRGRGGILGLLSLGYLAKDHLNPFVEGQPTGFSWDPETGLPRYVIPMPDRSDIPHYTESLERSGDGLYGVMRDMNTPFGALNSSAIGTYSGLRDNPHSKPPVGNYKPIPGISAPLETRSNVDLSIKVEVGSLEEMRYYFENEFGDMAKEMLPLYPVQE